MIKTSILVILTFYVSFSFFGQEVKKTFLKPYKVGVLYNYGNNKNFMFNNHDYTFSVNTFKVQGIYALGNWKKLELELLVQPQIQFLRHQLVNPFFVKDTEENYQEKRVEFTTPKSMHLYGIEFGFVAKRKLTEKLDVQGGISLGFSYINTRTERLAKGFTFIENFTLGLSFKTFKQTFVYLGSNFGHTSNLNFKKPNNGYNILGVDVGISYLLN